MIWLVPIAWVGAAAVASPILIHLLARPRAAQQPFPTLRFLPVVDEVALRRRRVEEVPLLLVRCAILVSAAAAVAGPLVLTAARRAAWNARLVRETVDGSDGDIRTGLARAAARLDVAPPGRREIVVRSAFPVGSIADDDVAAVPRAIGLRFERTGALPARREADAPAVLVSPDRLLRRRVTLDGPRTTVRDVDGAPAETPIDIVARADARASLAAVFAERVPAPPSGRRARLLVADAPTFAADVRDAVSVRDAWIGAAIATIARDEELLAVVARAGETLSDPAFARQPWLPVARNRDGRLLAAAAADSGRRLIVAVATPSSSFATAVLMRSTLDALAPPTRAADDVVAIGDAQLHAWSRDPAGAAEPRRDTIDDDDRRVLWIAVIVLLGVETWMRRER